MVKKKSNLVQMSQMLDNVIFIDPIKNIQVQSILKKFDVCFVGAKNLKFIDMEHHRINLHSICMLQNQLFI